MSFNIRDGLCYDDVLLVPQYSTVESRSKVDLTVKWGALKYDHPIIPANMKTITGSEMAAVIAGTGGLAILNRFIPFGEQLECANNILGHFGDRNFAISIGVKKEELSNLHTLMSIGVRIFCIDIAHGDSEQCVNMIKDIKNLNPDLFIIAGNVATGKGARKLWEAGADVVKVGVGPGSLCTTRIETGNGVPQLTALMDVAETQRQLNALEMTRLSTPEKRKKYPFIADGGVKSAGDIVKALCFADMVMAGNLFAGCAETPGKIMKIDGCLFKEYVGSSTHKTRHIEGVASIVPTKGKFQEVLVKLLEGLRSGCSYQGAHNLTELKDNPEFVKITGSGLRESHPHDVTIR